MKTFHFTLLAIFIFPLLSEAQITLPQMKGKWTEVTRTKEGKSTPIEYSDTIRFDMMESGYTLLRYDMGVTWIGDAELNKNKLKLKGLEFDVDMKNNDALLLTEKGVSHYFNRVTQFGAAPIQKVIPGVTTGEIKLDLNNLKGKWTCYRKTDPGFDKEKMYIKLMDIKDQVVQSFDAQLGLHNMDTLWYTHVNLTIDHHQIVIKGAEVNTVLQVLKSDGEELIAVDGKTTYYFKRFGKKNDLMD